MFRLNTDSINSDVIMVENSQLDYYDRKDIIIPSTESIEEILNMVDRQKKIFDEVYNEIFLNHEIKPEFIDADYEIQIPVKAEIRQTNCCFCGLLLLFLVTMLFSTIYFSMCIRNEKKIKNFKVDPFDLENPGPKIIKVEALEIKS